MRRLDIAIKSRLADLQELFQVLASQSHGKGSNGNSGLLYISSDLRWWALRKAIALPVWGTTPRHEMDRISALNRLIEVRFDEHGRFHGERFMLDLPPEFPNAKSVITHDLREIYMDNAYAAHFPFARLICDGDTVLDCGANLGAFSIYAATSARDVRVLAFEPEPITYRALVRNVELNGLQSQIKCFPNGITNEPGTLTLTCRPDCFTMNQFSKPNGTRSENTVDVQCVAIDDVVREHNLERVDVIKMDVEGAERLALAGAVSTLQRFHPRLTIAAYHLASDPYVLSKLIKDARPEYNVMVTRDLHLSAF